MAPSLYSLNLVELEFSEVLQIKWPPGIQKWAIWGFAVLFLPGTLLLSSATRRRGSCLIFRALLL
jgi:hypothetical protein